jgi:NADPH:quinone reductase-like Zn-dependent oxidoreductase
MLDRALTDAEIYEAATQMPAIAMTDFPQIGHVVDQLKMISVPVPRPKAGEVAIKLAASALHIDEIYAAQGTSLGRFFGPKHVSEKQPYMMGSSVSGTVVAVGDKVTRFNIGDPVVVVPNEMGETGSWATYRCVTEKSVLAKPGALSHLQAAGLTMASCVAWGAIETSRVRAGERCLVIGASGAIGALMVQFLKGMNADVTGVCSGVNADLVRHNGADAVIDYTDVDSGDSGANSFDIVFDTIGGLDTERSAARVLSRDGRFVTIVGPRRYIGEKKLSWFAFSKVVGHIAWRFVASRLHGPRYIFGERLPRKTIQAAFAQVERHGIQMPIDSEISFELAAIKDAVKLLTSHRAKGRIVINFQRPPEQHIHHLVD